MNLVKELNKSISVSPFVVQVSINGVWEENWETAFQDGMPSLDAIEKYLAKGTERIALEVFFKTNDGYSIILGIRFKEGLKVATPRDFLITSFQSIWSINPPTFSGIIHDLSEKLTGDADNLFGIYPTGIELGVIGWWRSMGYTEIWNDKQEKTINLEELKKQFEKFPHLLQNKNHFVALELNYSVVPHYWLGIQISDKKGDDWILNEDRLENLLKTLLGISVQ